MLTYELEFRQMALSKKSLFQIITTALVLLLFYLIYLDVRITNSFSDNLWEIPARVYARPLEIYPGLSLTSSDLSRELEWLGYKKVTNLNKPGETFRKGNFHGIYTRGFNFSDENEISRKVNIRIKDGFITELSSRGEDIELMRLDPLEIGAIYPAHGEDRLLLRLDNVPPTLINGLLAIEDQGFENHLGFSFKGIFRALIQNLSSGKVVSGGSTITQQLVKNYYLTPERTLLRKVNELLMAILLELHYTKPQILENYLNEIYLGQDGRRAIHGFGLAAKYYFNKPLVQLGLHEQALLIGMIKGPSFYNPKNNKDRATNRRNLVLDEMKEFGVITREEALVAKSMPLQLNFSSRRSGNFPAYLNLVHRQLSLEYRERDLTSLGLKIFTNFDPILQKKLEQSTSTILGKLPESDDLETGSIVTKVDTGEVVALVGGRKSGYAGFNRALDARRPAGSLLKPAVYLAALEEPSEYTLATLIDDVPLTVKGPGGRLWKPRNFDRKTRGKVPLRQGLSQSLNLATARLGMTVGLDKLLDVLHRLGIDQPVPQVPSLTLGSGEYSPYTMAKVYQSIASGGFQLPLRSIREIVDSKGKPLRRFPLTYDRTFNLSTMHLLQYVLREAVRTGTGKSVYYTLDKDFDVAGKTGTTNDGRDSWFAGFSGDLLAVTWIGRDDNGITGLTGATGALRIWTEFMRTAARRSLIYRMPEGVEAHWVNEYTSTVTDDSCENSVLLPFISGTQPAQYRSCKKNSPAKKSWFQSLFGR